MVGANSQVGLSTALRNDVTRELGLGGALASQQQLVHELGSDETVGLVWFIH